MRVTPNASQNAITGLAARADGSEALGVKVTAPPDKGRANHAVILLIAKALGLPKSALAITAGHTGRNKTLTITTQASGLAPVLDALAGPPDRA